MLFLLTGEVQTGKTRWLESLVARLSKEGIASFGVVAPGVWVKSSGSRSDANGFEKLGIDNVLLPEGTVVPFARRRDLAQAEGSFDARSQSAAAGLRWEISDEAIRCVNRHFANASTVLPASPSLLVVDELGQLELRRDGGLSVAVRMLERGSTAAFPHALAVVRRDLLPFAKARLSGSWERTEVIEPCEGGLGLIMNAFDLR